MNTILLVDDDDYVINGLLKHIPWATMDVRVVGTAADGEEGLRKFRELKPDFVITDIYMAVMDGFQLTEEIHRIDPNVPVVILSGYDDLTNARKAVSSGIQHFLLKPPSIAEIEFVVREVLQQLNESREHEDLLAAYLQQQEYVQRSMKDHFFTDLLFTRYREEELPRQRITFMGLPEKPAVQVLTLALIRPDARRDEREWQLLRFGTGNIIREMLDTHLARQSEMCAEVLEVSDQEFVVVFLGEIEKEQPQQEQSQKELSQQEWIVELSNMMLENILQYMKLSVLAGLGSVRCGYHHVIDSYLESRGAVEIAEMNEWNRVYVYDQMGQLEPNTAIPMDAIRLLHHAIFRKEWQQAYEVWQRLGDELAGQLREEQTGRKSHALVDRVIADYIEKCYHEQLSLEQIASKLHVNRNYLSQLFKRVTGEPFVTYLNKYRIRKAIELIRAGNYMVYEISERVGFQNSTYFSQVFKSITGFSPSEYNR